MKVSQASSTKELERIARKIRFRTIRNSHLTGTPHLGSCLSCTDLLVWLYWNILKLDSRDPNAPARDRFILSKGHAAPVLFQVLAERGFYPMTDLQSYGNDGSIFGEHPPSPEHLSGIEAATGSLGHGLPMGLGMALAGRLQKSSYNVYVILSDGECNEGSVWEAVMAAPHFKLDNLIAIIDRNSYQQTGAGPDIMNSGDLRQKFSNFGWHAVDINGHDTSDIYMALNQYTGSKPKAIIAKTIKGKGFSFSEGNNAWHHAVLTEKLYNLGLIECEEMSK